MSAISLAIDAVNLACIARVFSGAVELIGISLQSAWIALLERHRRNCPVFDT